MIPSMVSLEERAVLKQFLALCYDGRGEVVEVGALAGSSAMAMLQGLREARLENKVYVFDAFRYPTNHLEHTYRGVLGTQGESFRSVFDRYTQAWVDDLIVTEGDASRVSWTAGDIGFMHFDCSVSREFHEAIALEFYPNFLNGTILVHQDYGYEKAPFIADIMGRLKAWFKPWLTVGTSAYFKCTSRPERAEIEKALHEPLKAAA